MFSAGFRNGEHRRAVARAARERPPPGSAALLGKFAKSHLQRLARTRITRQRDRVVQ
jgi:hypothetical protein